MEAPNFLLGGGGYISAGKIFLETRDEKKVTGD